MSNPPKPLPPNSSDSALSVHQDVEGDQNQIIGQVSGGIVINQLTIHDRVPAASTPPPVSEMKPLTQQEYRQRQVLVNKVKEYWIKGVLETSLHAKALIELGVQERLDLVQRPFSDIAEFPTAPGQTLQDGTDTATVFEQMGAGRTLLILGEPGSGKTITLLKLAQDLIVRTEPDLRQPIPVMFNLSSWARKPQSIEQWLVQELLEKYQVSKALGKVWVETESLILLLDGLDEVKAEQRNACVQALNQFMQTHGTTELTICCRIRDYQALTRLLTLRSAVCIQPLTPNQVNEYFEQAGQPLSALKTLLHQDNELQSLATSPLMLSVMSLAYQGCAIADLVQGGTPENYRHRLFDTYIDRMFFRRHSTQPGYTKEKTKYWLSWLAQKMRKHSQSTFLIEGLQPNWLRNSKDRLVYILCVSIIFGLLFSPISFLFNIGIFDALRRLEEGKDNLDKIYPYLLIIPGLATEAWILLIGLAIGLKNHIKTVEAVKWSSSKAIYALKSYFPGNVSSAWLNWVIVTIQSTRFIGIPLFLALASGLYSDEIKNKVSPNQGIYATIKNACIFLIVLNIPIIGISIALVRFALEIRYWYARSFDNLSLPFWYSSFSWLPGSPTEIAVIIFAALAVSSLVIGGIPACIQHFTLRLILYCEGSSPWNYARFLEYATDRLFLQKVGGGYIFVHRMLLEHFAQMPLDRRQG